MPARIGLPPGHHFQFRATVNEIGRKIRSPDGRASAIDGCPPDFAAFWGKPTRNDVLVAPRMYRALAFERE